VKLEGNPLVADVTKWPPPHETKGLMVKKPKDFGTYLGLWPLWKEDSG
jgi:hypothetical protein